MVSCEEVPETSKRLVDKEFFSDISSEGYDEEEYNFNNMSKFYAQKGATARLPKPFPDVNNYVQKITDPPCTTCSEFSEAEIPEAKAYASSKSGKTKTLKWIAQNLKGGVYKFQKPPGPLLFPKDHIDICRSIDSIITGKPKKSKDLVPTASHCSNAGFIGVLLMLKENNPKLLEDNKDDFMCDPNPGKRGFSYGKGYVLFANNFNGWVKKYLGKSKLKVFDRTEINYYAKKGIPELGDSVNIYRKDTSGHQVIFSHYKKSPNRICYWSSNTNRFHNKKKGYDDGMGLRCEKTSVIKTLSTARL